MLTRSELTKAQAKDLLEKIQSNMFAGINCGWRREMVGSVLGLNEVDCFWGSPVLIPSVILSDNLEMSYDCS